MSDFNIAEARKIYSNRLAEYSPVFDSLYSEFESFLKSMIEGIGAYEVYFGEAEYKNIVNSYEIKIGRKSLLPLSSPQYIKEFMGRARDRLNENGFFVKFIDGKRESTGFFSSSELALEIYGWDTYTSLDDLSALDSLIKPDKGASKNASDASAWFEDKPEENEDIDDSLYKKNITDFFESIGIDTDEKPDKPKKYKGKWELDDVDYYDDIDNDIVEDDSDDDLEDFSDADPDEDLEDFPDDGLEDVFDIDSIE